MTPAFVASIVAAFLFVHGAWHGGWVWRKVRALLEESGHRVQTPGLPGHGRDRTPLRDLSLEGYAARVCELLDAEPEPAILAGHSLSGAVISLAAERRPGKVLALVYVCAFLLDNGETVSGVSLADGESRIREAFAFDRASGTLALKPDAPLEEILYNGCPPEDAEAARRRLVPEPAAVFNTPVAVSRERFGRAPRFYIECLHDRTISPAAQKAMYARLPCRKVFSLDSGHSPMLSCPRELTGALNAIAEAVHG